MSVGTGWAGSWRAALRIARREVRMHKVRSILVALMLALPTFGVAAADTVVNSERLTVAEQATRDLGASDAFIDAPEPMALDQTPSLDPQAVDPQFAQQIANGSAGTGTTHTFTVKALTAGQSSAILKAALPHATLLPSTTAVNTEMRGPGGYSFLNYDQLALDNPALAGLDELTSGRMPRTASEIVLTESAAQQLGATVGSTVTLEARTAAHGKSANFAVVGIVREPNAVHDTAAFSLPSAPAAVYTKLLGDYAVNPGGVSWSQVEALNKGGYVVASREVAENPPAASQVPYNSVLRQLENAVPGNNQLSQAAAQAAVGAIAVGMVLLEVVLLAGPAFAVGAKRRRREYALIGAVGADRRQLRRLVLAEGVVLGAVGAVIGAGLGLVAGAAALTFIWHFSGQLSGALDISALHVGGAAVLAVLLGLASALIPALAISRQDILSTLLDRRATRRLRWKLPIAGLAAVAAGLGAAVYGTAHAVSAADASNHSVKSNVANLPPSTGYAADLTLVIGGIALLEIGAIMCTPALLQVAAFAGRIFPLGPRLALRDGARHAGRTTPAVAALFAAIAGAVAAGIWMTSFTAWERNEYKPQLRFDQVAVSVSGPAQARSLLAQLSTILPITGHTTVQAVNGMGTGEVGSAPVWHLAVLSPGRQCSSLVSALQSELPQGVAASVNAAQACGVVGDAQATDDEGVLVGGPGLFQEITGIDDPAATSVLNRSGIVVFANGVVSGGQAQLILSQINQTNTLGAKDTVTPGSVTVPAVYENPSGVPNPGVWISPGAAHKLGLPVQGEQTLVMDLASHITAQQEAQADQILDAAGVTSGLVVDNGYQTDRSAIVLVVLALAALLSVGAAAIATGLAITDARADLQTLDAVGASPITRRVLAGSTVLVITGLGSLIGLPIGFAAAAMLIRIRNSGTSGPGLFSPIARALSEAGVQQQVTPGVPFAVPWLGIVGAVIAIPLATVLGAVLLTRSKSAYSRRIT